MNERFSDDEMVFINDVLKKHGEYITRLLKKEITSKRLVDSTALRSSISTHVKKYGLSPVLALEFRGYGRAIEINWHKKSQNTYALLTGSVNRQSLGKKPKKKKNTLWYSKNVYGSLNTLIAMLMYEYTDEIKNGIKDSLQNQYTARS